MEIDVDYTRNKAFQQFEDVVRRDLANERYRDARARTTRAINECPRESPDFQNYLSLALVVQSTERLSELGIRAGGSDPAGMGMEPEKIFLDQSTLDGAIRRTQDFLRGAIYKARGTNRPCPNCGAPISKPGERVASIGEEGAMYFDINTLGEGLLEFGYTFQSAASLKWLIDLVIAKENLSVPVGRCDDCCLSVVLWPFEDARVGGFYNRVMPESVAPSMSGRADNLNWVQTKSYFPIFVARWLRGVAGRTILDFGCGEGIMLWFLKTFGAEVSGVELSQSRAAYANFVLDVPDITTGASWPDNLANKAGHDVVIGFHSLEHVLDLDRTLRDLRGSLKPDGTLFLAVPDDEVGGTHTIGIDLRFFERVLPRHGLKIEQLSRDDGDLPKEFRIGGSGPPVWSGLSDILVIARAV
jgi:2-polyprenyl-3-methyl-5-hydroxy-6-metoxy-1,4-benzoquinol methylase